MQNRNLTDEDVQALADEIEKRMSQRFLVGAGKGAVTLIGRLAVAGILALAGYGFAHWHT